jgi:hypothetical protein
MNMWHVARGGARTLVVEAEDGERVVGPQLRELVVPAAVVRVEHHSPAYLLLVLLLVLYYY